MNKRQQGTEFYRKRAVWGCHEHAFTSHPPQLDEENRCSFWLPTCSGTALEWPKSKLASLKGSVLPSARTKVRPRMRCCKKRGIIYTDGGEAPVMREPSLKIIGMLVGSIACRAFSSILQKPRAFPRPQHDWPIYDAPSDEFKGDGFSGSLFQNADGRRQSG